MSVLDRSGALTAAVALTLVPLLLGARDAPGLRSVGPSPAAANVGAALGVEHGAACRFVIVAHNNIGEDVWVLFNESRVSIQQVNLHSRDFKDVSNRKIAPGKKIDVRFEAPGSCGVERDWFMDVRIGPRGGERIMVFRRTEGRNDRTVHLGEAACWATAATSGNENHDRYVPHDDEAFGCDPASTRYGLAPDPEEDGPFADEPAAGAGDETAEPVGLPADVSLEGNWLRRDSNNPRNNGMRISVQGDRATLTAMPPTGSRRFQTGQVIWQSLMKDGTVRVRGSDGGYYSARVSMEGLDRLHIDIDHNGPGNDQTWVRAGPSIDGDWVLVEASDGANEGLQVQVQGSQATLRFVPPTASRSFRAGAHTWRDIGGGDQPHLGQLEALTKNREYRTAQFRLLDENRLRVVFDAGGTVQLWARPGVAKELIAARERGEPLANVPQPQEPADDPLAQGGDLNPPGEEQGVEVPEDLPPMESKCLTTSLPNDRTDVGWRWEIEAQMAPYTSALRTEEGISGARHGELVADVDRSYAPGVRDHFASIATDDGGGPQYRDLSADELETRIELLKSEGYRLADLEGYTDSGDVRYAGVWVRNPDEIDWVPAFGRTDSEYESLLGNLRDSGYRLADLEVYSTPEGLRYAGIWVRSCDNTNWRQDTDLTKEQFEARAAELTPLGFNIVDFESYESDSGQLYGAIWEKTPGRAWTVARDQDLKWFLNHHRRYTDLGARLIDYESYRSSDGIRYAGVWAENAPRYQYAARSAIDQAVENHRGANDLPGISVVVIQDGDIVYRRGFGFADRERQKWAHSQTVYLAASVSKAIGGTLAAKLQEAGLVDLEKPTSEYLDLPNVRVCDGDEGNRTCELRPPHTHTVEQLLAKTGCVWHYNEGRGRYTRAKGGGPAPTSRYYRWRPEALTQIWENPLLEGCTPGSNYNYSTHGFTFVGAVLEEVTQTDIATLIEQEIARPLNLTSMRAMFGPDGLPSDYDRAVPYRLTNRSGVPDPVSNPSVDTDYVNSSWKVLGGGIELHALDLARFGWKTLDGQAVSRPALDTLLWRSRTEDAAGWDIDDDDVPSVGLAWSVGDNANDPDKRLPGMVRDRWAIHGGSFRGARSELTIWRDRELIVAIMSNRRDHNSQNFPFTDLNNAIADAIRASNP